MKFLSLLSKRAINRIQIRMKAFSCNGVTWIAPELSDSVHPFLITIGVILTLVFVMDAVIAYVTIRDAKND